MGEGQRPGVGPGKEPCPNSAGTLRSESVPMVFFTELEQIASQFVWKYRKPGIAQSNLAKDADN